MDLKYLNVRTLIKYKLYALDRIVRSINSVTRENLSMAATNCLISAVQRRY